MSKELPDLTDREVVQLMAAQIVVMDNRGRLEEDYKAEIRKLARQYDVDHELLEDSR
jgi:hypothetical protein